MCRNTAIGMTQIKVIEDIVAPIMQNDLQNRRALVQNIGVNCILDIFFAAPILSLRRSDISGEQLDALRRTTRDLIDTNGSFRGFVKFDMVAVHLAVLSEPLFAKTIGFKYQL